MERLRDFGELGRYIGGRASKWKEKCASRRFFDPIAAAGRTGRAAVRSVHCAARNGRRRRNMATAG
jgi:hypothetical protein